MIVGSVTARAREFVKSLRSVAAAATTIELYEATALEKL